MRRGAEIVTGEFRIAAFRTGFAMTSIRSYRYLIVWQKSKELAKLIYCVTNQMPRSEQFGLTNQMRHAAVSIPSHIAERYDRKITPEYMRSLRIASGSQADLSTQYEIAIALDLIKPSQQTTALLTGVDRLLFALIRKLNP